MKHSMIARIVAAFVARFRRGPDLGPVPVLGTVAVDKRAA